MGEFASMVAAELIDRGLVSPGFLEEIGYVVDEAHRDYLDRKWRSASGKVFSANEIRELEGL